MQLTSIGRKGCFTAEEFVAAVHPRDHMLYPPTTLVQIENTHNRAGGVVFPQDEAERICRAASERGVATFLDGARLWNAAVASRRSIRELAAPFDLVSVALSKGLGAPAGSVLAGSRVVIHRCVRYRRMLGGAMRQVGILAAAGLHAIERNVERLADDHANARRMAERMSSSRHMLLDLNTVQTNILVIGLAVGAPDARTVIGRAQERGVLLVAFGPRVIRLVTHLDVTSEQCERAAGVLLEVVEA